MFVITRAHHFFKLKPPPPHPHPPPPSLTMAGWASSFLTPRGEKNKQFKCPVPTQGKEGLFKTELCRAFLARGVCAYGDKCSFAHGSAELKARDWGHLKYKTIECINYITTGMCRFGMHAWDREKYIGFFLSCLSHEFYHVVPLSHACFPFPSFSGTRCRFKHDESRVQIGINSFLLSGSEMGNVKLELVTDAMRLESLSGSHLQGPSLDGNAGGSHTNLPSTSIPSMCAPCPSLPQPPVMFWPGGDASASAYNQLCCWPGNIVPTVYYAPPPSSYPTSGNNYPQRFLLVPTSATSSAPFPPC
jgi:hypothetical protein